MNKERDKLSGKLQNLLMQIIIVHTHTWSHGMPFLTIVANALDLLAKFPPDTVTMKLPLYMHPWDSSPELAKKIFKVYGRHNSSEINSFLWMERYNANCVDIWCIPLSPTILYFIFIILKFPLGSLL